MTDTPPQLGQIPQQSGFRIPTLTSNMEGSNGPQQVENAKASIYDNASAAANTVQNHPTTQGVKDTLSNGPVAETVMDQKAKTGSEFSNLANSRSIPNTKTATGQNLTHYHSFFYQLLSWENPRATGIFYATSVLLIFAARYLPALRWSFKALYMVLGCTAAAEVVGKLVLSNGLAASFRPKKYYTIPRETLESSLEDVEQLINFFVIEFQRVLFAENVGATVAAFFAALVSYWLIKIVPVWGLCLIGTNLVFLGPLIYISNKELIDGQLDQAGNLASAQSKQFKDLAGHHVGRATESAKAYTSDYTSKASNYIGNARGRSTSPELSKLAPSGPGAPPKESSADFPHAPKQEPMIGVDSHQKQYENSQFGGQAQPAY